MQAKTPETINSIHCLGLAYFNRAEFADTVQCRMCHIQFPGEKCSRGRGICTADKNEACAVGRIYKKQRNLWSIWLIFMGCQRNCAEVEKIKWSVYMVAFRCCRSADLCNENLTRSG
ncbi:prostate and testis expressed protein 1 [Elephas maximus indicus]|uniref:prostate and testis expressed protein 1 n=1 Tax=Elephas maximus indicus TaxID=99487 RepID=UPI00211691A7|nr:prostate and testis expressed protein 1 [Elephas maximus indicus]